MLKRRRVFAITALFASGGLASVYDWHLHPPIAGRDGRLLDMRNGPGDLSTVLALYGVEFLVAIVALQPWNEAPSTTGLTLGCLSFLLWSIVRVFAGEHSPTVMLAHDLLVLVIALTLGAASIVLSSIREAHLEHPRV